jgi:hypothetical protein
MKLLPKLFVKKEFSAKNSEQINNLPVDFNSDGLVFLESDHGDGLLFSQDGISSRTLSVTDDQKNVIECFHGNITRPEAERLLLVLGKSGAYLLRKSSRHTLILSVKGTKLFYV